MSRQQEKSLATHRELKQSAYDLFLEKNFEQVGIADIVARAGYSVGAFYRHFPSKNHVFVELVVDYLEAFILESVLGAKQCEGFESTIDYLLARSKVSMHGPLLECYPMAMRIVSSNNLDPQVTDRFTVMLADLLRENYPDCQEEKYLTCASILHTMFNAHAMEGLSSLSFHFDDAIFKNAVFLIAGICQ